jgi:hypothetical protein
MHYTEIASDESGCQTEAVCRAAGKGAWVGANRCRSPVASHQSPTGSRSPVRIIFYGLGMRYQSAGSPIAAHQLTTDD